jgi:tetratricopeptide (TPR) repeat protein
MVDSHLREGAISSEMGDHGPGARHFREGLAAAKEYGDPNHQHEAYLGLGWIAYDQGRHSEARECFEKDYDIVSRLTKERMMHTLLGLGYASCALEEFERSRQCLGQALAIAAASNQNLEALDALAAFAHLAAGQGDLQQAAALLGFVLQHSATRQVTRTRAQRLLAEMESQLPIEATSVALMRLQDRDLKEVVAEVLQTDR